MNDTVDFWVLRKHFVEGGFAGHVDLVEQGPLPTDQLNAIYRHLGRVVKVVDNDDIVVIFEQRKGGERPNVAGATVSHPYQRQMYFFFFWGIWRGCFSRLARPCGGVDSDCGEGSQGRRGEKRAYPVTRTVPTAMISRDWVLK